MTGIPWKRVARVSLIVGPLLILLPWVLGWVRSTTLTSLEHYLYDQRVRIAMPGGVDPRVVIVDIDESSIAREGHWPWNRTKLAALLDALFDTYGARVVAFDVLFSEAGDSNIGEVLGEVHAALGDDPELHAKLEEIRTRFSSDERFAESLIARDVVLGYAFRVTVDANQPAQVGVLPPPLQLGGERLDTVRWLQARGYVGIFAPLASNAASGGFVDTPLTDADGVIRRMPLMQRHGDEIYESLDLATARLALGNPSLELGFMRRGGVQQLEFISLGARRIAVDARGSILAPFRGPTNSFPYVSATRVLRGEASPQTLKDAIVLIGTTAAGLNDLRPTPVDREYPGVEAHANVIASLLDSTILAEPWWAPRFTVLLMLAMLAYFAFSVPRLSAGAALAWSAVIGIMLIIFNVGVWKRSGIVLPLAAPLIYLAVTSVLLLAYGYLVESRRKRRLSRIFSQYVPPEIVQELDATETEVSLEGDSRDMSVLFSDVRGFTTLSEGLSPRDLTRLMNEMLTPLTQVIHDQRGTIDKYMGDAIMAFWGAPLPDPAHAQRAVAAALAMIQATARIRAEFAERGWPPLHIGVGISTGPMNVGNMGSQFRMAYTVLGDTVNLGSRLEGLTKQYGVDVIVSGATVAQVPDMLFRELDAVRVKGKNEPVAIFEPLGPKTAADGSLTARTEGFHEMLRLYRAREFGAAHALLEELAREKNETLLTLYRDRVSHFLREPPPDAWDGVFVHQSK
jgi:adenylate cyclase